MKISRSVLLFCIIFMVLASALRAEDGVFVTHNQCNDLKGTKLWEETVTIGPLKQKGLNVYLLKEERTGIFGGYTKPVRSVSEIEFISKDDNPIPLKMERAVYSTEGSCVARETQVFRTETKEVECEVDRNGRYEKKVFKCKGEVINRLLIGLYIRNFLKNGEKRKTVNLISDEPSLYRITLQVMGKEEIKVNGSLHEAYRIYINPNIGLFSPVKVLLPKNYSWYSTQPPYRWLMFRGLDNSINSPKVEIFTLDK